jgi:hypothetical protein
MGMPADPAAADTAGAVDVAATAVMAVGFSPEPAAGFSPGHADNGRLRAGMLGLLAVFKSRPAKGTGFGKGAPEWRDRPGCDCIPGKRLSGSATGPEPVEAASPESACPELAEVIDVDGIAGRVIAVSGRISINGLSQGLAILPSANDGGTVMVSSINLGQLSVVSLSSGTFPSLCLSCPLRPLDPNS